MYAPFKLLSSAIQGANTFKEDGSLNVNNLGQITSDVFGVLATYNNVRFLEEILQ